MKWLIAALLLLPFTLFGQTPFKGSDYLFYYQVNVGKTNGTSTTASAWLEIGKDSTTKGMRVPRVVDTTSISAPVFGLLIYRITDNALYFRDKFGWRKITDAAAINNYLLKSDSTTLYYPLNSNPKNFVITELDPSANAKTIRWIPGAGIRVSNSSPQALSTNPSDSIVAKVDSAIWNANRLQSAPISATPPTSGQILQYNGSQYIPVTLGGGGGSVTSVGLAMPSMFTVTNSPVITSGTLTAAFNNQFANLVLASPNGISGQPSFRGLANGDLPNSAVSAGTYGNDTAFNTVQINSKGIVTNATTNILTLDKVLRGGNATARTISLQDTTGQIVWPGVFSDGALIKYYSTGDGDGSSNLIFETGDNAIADPLEGFIFRRDNSNGVGPKQYDTTLRINNNGITTSRSVIAQAPTYSTGGITSLGRNNTTGRFETFTPTPTGPASVKGFNTDATAADTLYAYTVPSTYLINNGDNIKMIYAGTFSAASGTDHGVGLAVGGSVLAALSNGVSPNGTWEIECTLIRVSNTVIRATTKVVFDNTGGVSPNLYLHTTSEVSGLNLSANGLRTGLSVVSPNTNVTATMGTITYYPAAL